mgnify:CR=1 FL=1
MASACWRVEVLHNGQARGARPYRRTEPPSDQALSVGLSRLGLRSRRLQPMAMAAARRQCRYNSEIDRYRRYESATDLHDAALIETLGSR